MFEPVELRLFASFGEASEGMVKQFFENLHRFKLLFLQAVKYGVKLVKLLFVFRVNKKIKI